MVSTEGTFHVIQDSVKLLNMQIWSIFGRLCQFWQPEHRHVLLQKKGPEIKMCLCYQSTVDKSAFASTYQYASLGSPFENQTSLSHSRSVTFKLDETPAWLPMDNHAGISVSFLNRCFNVTLPWHVCKRMISQRFITCHSQHMLGCWTTFIKTPV